MIRPARPADAPGVRALLRDADLPVDGLDAADAVVWQDADGAVRGVAAVEHLGDAALLRSVAVAPGARARGVAGALVSDRLDAAAGAGARAAYLLTTTAEGYFAQRGFARVDRAAVPDAVRDTAEFAALCPASAVVMRAALGG